MNTQLSDKELRELLSPTGRPTPPEGLAERIKSEIPDLADIAMPPAAPGENRVDRRWRRRTWMATAASVVLVAGAAFFYARHGRDLSEPPTTIETTDTVSSVLRADAPATSPAPPPAVPVESKNSVEPAPAPAGDRDDAGRERLRQLPRGLEDAEEAGKARAAAPAAPDPSPESSADLRSLGYLADEAPVEPRVEEVIVISEAPVIPPDAAPAEKVRSRQIVSARTLEAPADGQAAGRSAGRRNESEFAAAPMKRLAPPEPPPPRAVRVPAPSTGGTAEPNDKPYGDVFFEDYGTNPFIDTEDDHLSTFALDVDTASYTVVRRFLNDGHLPEKDAVRVDEMINYFDYGDAPPEEEDFAIHAEGAPSPYGEGDRYYLMRFHLRGREVSAEDRRPADLTFVVDVSGSMARENRLGLVRQALGLLLDELRPDDRVALVVYGSRGRVVLEHTGEHERIRRAIGELVSEGSTNAEEGLRLAYQLAARQASKGRISRVILCSDGVANVGNTGPDSILAEIGRYARQGVELTTVGFGMGNYNDVLMEQLADKGNGRYAYVDTIDEAERIFVENLTGTLQTIAAEARVQVDWNADVVSRYRLIGYENRAVADHRFRDDTVDAGEIGAGHAVTALYEIKLERPPRRGDRIGTLHLRFASMAAGEMVELERPVTGRDFAPTWEKASPALRLTSLVAEFGEILKHSYWAREGSLDDVFRRAQRLSPEFAGDHEVADLVHLMGTAARIAER